MSWGQETTTATARSGPTSRSTLYALWATPVAGLVWGLINLGGAKILLDRPDADLGTFVMGIAVVVFGSIGFAIIIVPTVIGLRARDDVARLGAAAFTALVAALGGVWWLIGVFSGAGAYQDLEFAMSLSGVVLLVPAGMVAWAWIDWSQS